ncbi:uncharacterized protein J4E78_009632 [Alternaria triticimaculans]|uniref:uncharacterized protein n=1 Tax=Alternaria triticimaculans TaxID=297637 RepID=UPI0020C3174C|nr:uncharacterized protein J4E78_009632 [Alternaria triticimaculans]KAI4644049.1 hypothetical protein J4E78_009632 [Alternaria triticimaculans]
MSPLVDLDILPEDADFGMVIEEAGLDDEADPEYVPRQRNMGKLQHRKFTGYDQRLPMVVYGFREETVHGTSANETPHTLIVFRWVLQQRAAGRRFRSAEIRAVFQTKHKKSSGSGIDAYYDPNVAAVAPNGTYSMLATPVAVSQTRSTEAGGDAGIEYLKGTAKVSYELTESVERVDQITINGTERSEYSHHNADEVGDPDRSNVAEWQLFENEAAKSGLPTFFRTAVLLERRDGDQSQFTCTFTIRAKVDNMTDTMTGLKRFIGRVPRDDPIIFAPSLQEVGALTKHKDKLDEVDLLDLCKFVMFNTGLRSGEEEARREKEDNVKGKDSLVIPF